MNFEYRCVECGRNYEAGEKIMYVCPVCSRLQKPMESIRGVLRIILPYADLSLSLNRYSFYPHSLLPIEEDHLPLFPVGNTPLLAPKRIRNQLNIPNLYIKNEGQNPTGSIKDRGAFLIAALAKKMHENKIIVASNGNEASAMACLSAATGLECTVFFPENVPKSRVVQSMIYGAKVIRVKGSYHDAYELSLRYTEKRGGINRNTAFNPFTIEGKKTAAFEIYNQLDHSAPDYIFIPTGDGVALSGIYKGFYDLFQFDWISAMPKLVVVQAEGNDAIVSGIKCKKIEPAENTETIADSIRVAAPLNGYMALKDIDRTEGFGLVVSDSDILNAQKFMAQNAGIFAEPAAAVAFAGFLKARENLEHDATVVILSTGSGLNDLTAASKNIILPNPIEPQVDVNVI